jgi:hypothetical protein
VGHSPRSERGGAGHQILNALVSTGLPISDARNGLVKRLIQIGDTPTSSGALGQLLGTLPNVTLAIPNILLTAPATVNLFASVSILQGAISRVEFYRNAALIATVTTPSSGTASSGIWTYSDTNVPVGTYSYTARAYDNASPSASTTSAAVPVSVTAAGPGSMNVAAQANGAVASASSLRSAGHPAAGAINGDRRGLNWGADGGWSDGTPGSFPDWLQVNFSGTHTIAHIDVFTLQDDWESPAEPTPTMTFTQYGISAFQVQYWTGSAWADVPGGHITGNNHVWRRVSFTPLSTSAIRVLVNAALNSHSRIVEVEAWTPGSAGNLPPTVNLSAPVQNTMLATPATVNVAANVADADGVITRVEFYRNSTLIATVTTPSSGNASSGIWTYNDVNVPVGTHSYTARAYDNASPSAFSTSAAMQVSVTAAGAGSMNVAAQANGAVASASSLRSAGHPAAGAINGDRRGLNWSAGGGWSDGTPGSFPDWLQVNFSGTQTIAHVDVFTLQDDWESPAEPTSTMTFTQYGITAFQVQYWTGSAWADVPGGHITGNNHVWRRVSFTPLSTSAIRVLVNAALNSHSRIVEVEAWTPGPINVAAQSNGAVASASSLRSAGHPAAGAINGDRRGLNWSAGGGWSDGTPGSFPDWLQVNFSGTQTIAHVDVFTLQDDWESPAEPTSTMTFTQYGITAFQVQYWTGSAWADVPGGHITGNSHVWRRVSFTPLSTSAIRVLVNAALNSHSRIVEVEAWTTAPGG